MLIEFLERFFPRHSKKNSSRDAVKQRLQILLAHDRTDLTPDVVEKMRQEIMEVVSRYVEIDPEGSEFMLENNQRMTALIANLPIKRVKKDESARVESPADLEFMQASPRDTESRGEAEGVQLELVTSAEEAAELKAEEVQG